MVTLPPAASTPLFTDSATATEMSAGVMVRRAKRTLDDVAVQGVDDDGNLGGRHVWLRGDGF